MFTKGFEHMQFHAKHLSNSGWIGHWIQKYLHNHCPSQSGRPTGFPALVHCCIIAPDQYQQRLTASESNSSIKLMISNQKLPSYRILRRNIQLRAGYFILRRIGHSAENINSPENAIKRTWRSKSPEIAILRRLRSILRRFCCN